MVVLPGREYNKDGVLEPWWSSDVITRFNETAQCFVEQYSNYTSNGEHVSICSVSDFTNGIRCKSTRSEALWLQYVKYLQMNLAPARFSIDFQAMEVDEVFQLLAELSEMKFLRCVTETNCFALACYCIVRIIFSSFLSVIRICSLIVPSWHPQSSVSGPASDRVLEHQTAQNWHPESTLYSLIILFHWKFSFDQL